MTSARDLLTGTVSIPSLSGEEGPVAEYLSGWMAAHGFSAQVDEAGNAVGERGTGPLTVVLLGHIDTVPGDIPVRVEGERLYGRGSVDAKGSFCTFVAAVAALPESALRGARFVCIGATEEEAPSSRGARHAARQYAPDFVLIGEPSGWAGLTLGYKGRLVVQARVQKDNFHTAGEGTSAADDLTEAWFRVRSWGAAEEGRDHPGGGIFGAVQATIQGLSARTDGLAQVAEGTFGLRLPPRLSPEAVEEALSALLADLPVTLTFVGHEAAVRHGRDNALTRALRVAIREQGGTPVFKVKTGTSDMNVVARHWPVPTVAYGPGDSSLDHTPNEHLDLAEYDRAVAVLTSALTRLAATTGN
ncbi:[LysW]-lysine hydrolase [Deinococcus hopiensis]|uniref:[LysW]-lysine hydrolase n=1 Tax=Deinococcus hopiensis KR-140 TaxID=695939 RepID=A0A1W1VEE2_9DEIO|nr:[LysW]-lysine hydrolase [Deinococcus hopiensis]SMB91695.1 acetylornithine deacetylase [Deinococcus hopiensis KR-140]